MKRIVKIKGGEHDIQFVRFREKDFLFGGRNTVTILTELSYAEVVDLFSDPGEWSVVTKYEPRTGKDGEVIYQQPDTETDCTDYFKLISIKDTRTGVLEIVLSKMTDSEALAELREALEK